MSSAMKPLSINAFPSWVSTAPIYFKELVLDRQAANAFVSHTLFKFQAFDFLRLFFCRLRNLGTSIQKLPFSLVDLVGMNLKLLGKL
jgi:hypothetical protein